MNLTVRDADLHSGGVFGNATGLVQTVLIENVHAISHGIAFNFDAPYTPGTNAEFDRSAWHLRHAQEQRHPDWPGTDQHTGEPFPLKTIKTYARYIEPVSDEREVSPNMAWGLPLRAGIEPGVRPR